MELQKYCVGEKIDINFDNEGAKVEADDNNLLCFIGLKNISEREKRAIEKGKISISLSEIERIIFLCISADDCLEFDMPFNMGLYKEFKLNWPESGGYLMPIILFDLDTKIIKAIRVVGFDIVFSRKIHTLSTRQWNRRIENYNELLESVNSRFTTEQIMERSIMNLLFKGVHTDIKKKWSNYEFVACEDRTGSSFDEFYEDLKADLERQLEAGKIKVISFNKGFFSISGFVYNPQNERYAYFTTGDVRDVGIWYNRIIVREARNDKDYTGGINRFISYDNIGNELRKILESRRSEFKR